MMISPEGFYETELKDKNEKQLLTIIRGLKNEIGHLKNVMEHPNYGAEAIIHPSESTRLWCMREYLEQAKIALAEVGGIYKPSQSELKALEFDNNISAIEKIVFSIGGFFQGNEIREITFDGENLQLSAQHSFPLEPKDSIEFLLPYDKEDFVERMTQLHIGEWRSSYTLKRSGYKVLDGTQWELEIHYNNGAKPFKSHGDNSFPYNFDEFQELIGFDTSVGEEDNYE